jgi:hypothetical protein
MDVWDEERLQSYIDNFVEESLTLDYKAAEALERTDKKRDQITKDVSAMANSDGGIIIYGLKEYREPEKKYLPEKIDPIDRSQFSRESLEQIINNIRPHIPGLIIYPVAVLPGPNDVAYVVDIPRSYTAHQAKDHRYYKRHNFLAEPMEDYEVRDTMNRATVPNASVKFSYSRNNSTSHEHHYSLIVTIKNLGVQVINHLQLQFTFPQYGGNVRHIIQRREHIDIWASAENEYTIRYRANKVLFPEEEIEIGREMAVQYMVDSNVYAKMDVEKPLVEWRLNADSMPTKTGSLPFKELQCY